MRWPVAIILDMTLSEMTFSEILEDHPELEKEDVLACLAFAKKWSLGNGYIVSKLKSKYLHIATLKWSKKIIELPK